MGVLTDWQCARCGRKFGWSADRGLNPVCPRCGTSVDPQVAAQVEREIAAAREVFARYHEARRRSDPEADLAG